ncbi:MAG: hypothetical protein KDD00_07875 [Ignavibacteriae bacterium]|nr:hypothetical protein [Ignavibacteriota bacterium]
MKNFLKLFLSVLFFCLHITSSSQAQEIYRYEPSAENPFGLPNPDMPEQFSDFAPMIGECDCRSITRIDKDNWGDTVSMVWRFKYIMNGMAIQDETLKEDGKHSGSIRQFIADSSRWYVHYYSSAAPSTTLSAWEGNKTSDGNIILYRDQKSPNGLDGKYKITFSEISDDGFNWLGEWITPDESFSYPTWVIYCKKKLN